MATTKGSPVSPYLDLHSCDACGWTSLKCGSSGCEGYLTPEDTGHPGVVRYSCGTCSWTGTGARLPVRRRAGV